VTWNPIDHPVDVYLFEGRYSPGVTTLEGEGLQFDWEKKRGPGTTGATSKFNGTSLSTFQAKTLLWTPEHFEQWEAFEAAMIVEPGEKATAHDFYHPQTSRVGIVAVTVLDVGLLVPEDETGLWSVTVKFDQFRAPKPAVVKVPDGSKSEKDGDEDDPVERQIAEMTEEYRELADQ
jgi:hypothetical protein